jgi:uncharacterized membrane protein
MESMTTIDQRILIPVPARLVWEYISDINNNVRWQVDSGSVVFLTSKRDGPGLRWRNVTATGNEQVIEITAWYDGLGYQYTYIDGVPFRESKGTIRIQETPDGTVVQWTFNYELGGLLGGMRNSIGTSRHVDRTMADSLKTLWRDLRESGRVEEWSEAKSMMRPAPDVEERAQYKSRRQADGSEPSERPQEGAEPGFAPPSDESIFAPPDSAATLESHRAGPLIPEPPLSDDDTRPRPAIQAESVLDESLVADPFPEAEPDFLTAAPLNEPPVADPFPEAEPDFLADLTPPDPKADTKPMKPVTDDQMVAEKPDSQEIRTLHEHSPIEPDPASLPPDDDGTEPDKVTAPPSKLDPKLTPEIKGAFVPEEAFATTTDERPATTPYESDEFDAIEPGNMRTKTAEEASLPSDLQDDLLFDFSDPNNIKPLYPADDLAKSSETVEAALSPEDEARLFEPLTEGEDKDADEEKEPATPNQQITETKSPPVPEPEISLFDTATVSIWEVFGMPRPSETQELQAVSDSDMPQAVSPEPEAKSDESTPARHPRRGLRQLLRRRHIHLKHPN